MTLSDFYWKDNCLLCCVNYKLLEWQSSDEIQSHMSPLIQWVKSNETCNCVISPHSHHILQDLRVYSHLTHLVHFTMTRDCFPLLCRGEYIWTLMWNKQSNSDPLFEVVLVRFKQTLMQFTGKTDLNPNQLQETCSFLDFTGHRR